MTVRELIAKLSEVNQNLPVVVTQYSDAVEVTELILTKMYHTPGNQDYYSYNYTSRARKALEKTDAIYIS